MRFDYQCQGDSDMERKTWKGEVQIIRMDSNSFEAIVEARWSTIQLICGHYSYGNYVCVPKWGIGSELVKLSDRFWNLERLILNSPGLSRVDAISIIDALVAIDKHINFDK